jgi:predicted Co/Zn/Cd cation transporter (cation efflux family)
MVTPIVLAINFLMLAIAIYAIYRAIKGKHRQMEKQVTATNNTTNPISTILHVSNSVQMRPETSDNSRDQNQLLTNFIKQPQEYNGCIRMALKIGNFFTADR